MTSEFDVIITGAGPAGCTAALALGSSGLKVALIEKERFPREKVCGDALPAYVPKVLKTIGTEYAKAFDDLAAKEKVFVSRIVSPDGHILDLKFPEPGFICKRLIFDNFLFEQVLRLPNVTIFQESPVRDVSKDKNGVLVSAGNDIALRGKLVIGCDGANSIIRKTLSDTEIDPRHCSGAVRAYFKNVRGIPENTFELHFLKELIPGYFWIFPLPENYSNVGIGIPSEHIRAKKTSLRNELIRIIETDPGLQARFMEAEMVSEIKSYLLPLGSRKTAISGDRFMLCGDAAMLINPATGAGTGQAMQSGRFAGWQVLSCFDKNDFSADFMKSYDKIINDKIWRTNRNYYMIREMVINNPRILNTIAKAGSASKFINRIITKGLK
jgi:geranylgeranyl reductase family protein